MKLMKKFAMGMLAVGMLAAPGVASAYDDSARAMNSIQRQARLNNGRTRLGLRRTSRLAQRGRAAADQGRNMFGWFDTAAERLGGSRWENGGRSYVFAHAIYHSPNEQMRQDAFRAHGDIVVGTHLNNPRMVDEGIAKLHQIGHIAMDEVDSGRGVMGDVGYAARGALNHVEFLVNANGHVLQQKGIGNTHLALMNGFSKTVIDMHGQHYEFDMPHAHSEVTTTDGNSARNAEAHAVDAAMNNRTWEVGQHANNLGRGVAGIDKAMRMGASNGRDMGLVMRQMGERTAFLSKAVGATKHLGAGRLGRFDF